MRLACDAGTKRGLWRENMEGKSGKSVLFSIQSLSFFPRSKEYHLFYFPSLSFQLPTTIAKFILITCMACLKAVLTKPDSKPLST